MKSTKHAENMLKTMPSDLCKTSFQMKWFRRSLKPEARTSVDKYQKGVKYNPNPWTIDPGAWQKTMLKIIPNKIKTCSKNDLQINPKKWPDFRGGVSWGTFGGSNRFWASKVGPKCYQSASSDWKMDKTKGKMTTWTENVSFVVCF